jgi:glycosyltransferase involved in cell wall biosynthesis
MNILIVSNLFPPHFLGGYEILCAQVCQSLKERGHSLHVLTSDHGLKPEDPRQDVWGTQRIEVDRSLRLFLPFSQPPKRMRLRRWLALRRNSRIVRSVIERVRPDVVFIWSQLRLSIAAARVAQASGVRTVYTLNDEHILGSVPMTFSWRPRKLAGYVTDRWLLPSVTIRGIAFDRVTCISQRLKDNLIRSGVPIEQAKIIYQAIPIEKFPLRDNAGQIGNPVKALFVGQLHPDKGAQTLIAAAARLVEQYGPNRLEVSIIGDGGYRRELEKQAARSGAVIHFSGRVPHDEIPAVYRAHDLFVFPSIWQEPFGLTPLEAMASGLPVISTINGGHGEFIEHGVNALVFREGDSEELADRMRAIIEDEALRHRLVTTARHQVVERFSFDRCISELEAFLR